jgi:hypothetical protein
MTGRQQAGRVVRDARRRAEQLVTEHVTGTITELVEAYLSAVDERAAAARTIATADGRMRAAVRSLRALPGFSDEVVARLIQDDVSTVRRLARREPQVRSRD